MSVCSGTESLVCFSHWGSSYIFFFFFFLSQAVWKVLIWVYRSNNTDARRHGAGGRWHRPACQKSRWQVFCATEPRIIAIIAPLWGRSASYCAFISFHLPAVSSRKHPGKAEKYTTQPRVLILHPLHIKLLVWIRWMGINRHNNRSPSTLNDSKCAVDSVISG